MFTYCIRNGKLWHNSKLLTVGYSGKDTDNKDDADDGKNDPSRTSERNVGAIPAGLWHIVGQPFDHPLRGKYCLRLEPDPKTETFGRDGFLCHGDSIKNPGTASHGCIILARNWRQAIFESGDKELLVISEETADPAVTLI